ncbi:PDZ domain-containing protein [Horticoccus sp. 23ND18S-11]|uniref:PDZ domain-containing protein n=1 Tax=Horticoccus sp. 23ND18S-11 TaxID=3391832 RepID=UPI0039C9297B
MMLSFFRRHAAGFGVALLLPLALHAAADLPTLWAERVKSVVAIEYVTETEVARQPSSAMGTVIDARGTIILPSGAIDPRAATWQLKEFKVFLPGSAEGTPGEYLGQDAFTGWHFVRAGEAIRSKLVPVTTFAGGGEPRAPALAEFVWGIGLRGKDEDFGPYILQSHVALLQSLPQRSGIAQQEVAAPGLPVFNRDGVLVGVAGPSGGQTFLQISRTGRPAPTMLINVEESSAFVLAGEVLPYLDRIPKNVSGRPLAWLGAYGLEPMDREVAKFLNLTAQSGLVVSEVLAGSPAEKAGLLARDIILAVDGRPLPELKPDRVVATYLEREIERRAPGDAFAVTVLRGMERLELKAVLGDEPKLMREAERKHFERPGVTVREFVYGDAIERRANAAETSGVIAHFVKPSSPVAIAGLRQEDWIREIDGVEVKTFAGAVAKLAEIDKDDARPEFVILVARGGETAVLRVKLK